MAPPAGHFSWSTTPDTVTAQVVRAGAKETSPLGDEHGWRLGRIIDPFGHEWEIGKPLGPWPPT